MTMNTELRLELQKLRHRHLPALFILTFALITIWMCWCLKDMDSSKTNDVSAVIFCNLLLMNTILCPVVIAALASRMCDMEQMGDTYKWLCTIQKPEHIYRGKVISGGFFLGAFILMQTVLYRVLSAPYGIAGLQRQLELFLSLYLSSLCIFILQLNLSLRFFNQLTPIFISIGGTFAGLFSWFLYQWPLRYLIPWGYYAALCNTGFIYDEASRYTTYFWDPYPVLWAVVLLAAIAGLYVYGRINFLKTVRKTM